MCLPALALAGLAMVAGGGLSYLGNKQAENAENSANNAERARQTVLTNQQQSLFKDSLSKASDLNSPDAQNKAIADRTTALTANLPPAAAPGSFLPGSSSAPAVVATAADKSSDGATAYGSNLASALARMGAPGDQLLTTNIGIGRNSGKIDQDATSKVNSAAVLQSELKAASYKGSFLRGLGSLATSIGGAMAGGAGGLAGGGATGSIIGLGGDQVLANAAKTGVGGMF